MGISKHLVLWSSEIFIASTNETMKNQTKLGLEFLDSQQAFTVFSVRCCMEGVLKVQQVVMEQEMKPCLRRWWGDQDLLLLNNFFEPQLHLNFSLPIPLWPPAALACSVQTGAVLTWHLWNLPIEPALLVLPVSYQRFCFSALAFYCTNHDMGSTSSLHFPTSALECSFCLYPSQNKYFPPPTYDRHIFTLSP